MTTTELTDMIRTSSLLPSLSERQKWITEIVPRLSAIQLAQTVEILRKAQAVEQEFAKKRLARLRQKEANLKKILAKIGSLELEQMEKTQTTRDSHEEKRIAAAIEQS